MYICVHILSHSYWPLPLQLSAGWDLTICVWDLENGRYGHDITSANVPGTLVLCE